MFATLMIAGCQTKFTTAKQRNIDVDSFQGGHKCIWPWRESHECCSKAGWM